MTLPCWLRRAMRNLHRHAIEQASRRWRGGRREDSARTCRNILISTQVPVAGALAPAVAHSHADADDGGALARALALADAPALAGADASPVARALGAADAGADDGRALAGALSSTDARAHDRRALAGALGDADARADADAVARALRGADVEAVGHPDARPDAPPDAGADLEADGGAGARAHQAAVGASDGDADGHARQPVAGPHFPTHARSDDASLAGPDAEALAGALAQAHADADDGGPVAGADDGRALAGADARPDAAAVRPIPTSVAPSFAPTFVPTTAAPSFEPTTAAVHTAVADADHGHSDVDAAAVAESAADDGRALAGAVLRADAAPVHTPTPAPTTAVPTWSPAPSVSPVPTTAVPSPRPSFEPTSAPTGQPTGLPTPRPSTAVPSPVPTTVPSPVPTALPYRVEGDLTFRGITVDAARAAEPLFIHVVAAMTNTSVLVYADKLPDGRFRPRSPTVDIRAAPAVRRSLRRRLAAGDVLVEYTVEVGSEDEADAVVALIEDTDTAAVDPLVDEEATELQGTGELDQAFKDAIGLAANGDMAATNVGAGNATVDPAWRRADRAEVPEDLVAPAAGKRDKLGGSSAGLVFVLCFVLVLISVCLYFAWPKICHEDEEEIHEEANGEELKLKHALQDADDEILEAGESHALHAKLEKKPVEKKKPKTVKTRVPPGTQPGTTLEATLSDGRKAQIAVPLDAKAGDALTVEVPEPEEITPEPPLPCLVTPEPPPPDVDHVAVEVPAGAEPGSVVEVAHADGRTVDVVVPDDAQPGETLFVPVDKKAPPPQIAEKADEKAQAAEVDKMLDEGQDEEIEHRELTVPAGARGGDRVQVAHPDGGAMDVVLPHDATPGETLLVPRAGRGRAAAGAGTGPVTRCARRGRRRRQRSAAGGQGPGAALVADARLAGRRDRAGVAAAPDRSRRTDAAAVAVGRRARRSAQANSAYPGGASLPPSPYPETKKAAEPKGAPEEKSTAPPAPAGAPESKSVAPAAASSKAAPVAKAAPAKTAAKATPKPKPKAVSALKQGVKGASSPALQERLSKLKAAGTPAGAPAAKKTSLQTKLSALGAAGAASGGAAAASKAKPRRKPNRRAKRPRPRRSARPRPRPARRRARPPRPRRRRRRRPPPSPSPRPSRRSSRAAPRGRRRRPRSRSGYRSSKRPAHPLLRPKASPGQEGAGSSPGAAQEARGDRRQGQGAQEDGAAGEGRRAGARRRHPAAGSDGEPARSQRARAAARARPTLPAAEGELFHDPNAPPSTPPRPAAPPAPLGSPQRPIVGSPSGGIWPHKRTMKVTVPAGAAPNKMLQATSPTGERVAFFPRPAPAAATSTCPSTTRRRGPPRRPSPRQYRRRVAS